MEMVNLGKGLDIRLAAEINELSREFARNYSNLFALSIDINLTGLRLHILSNAIKG